MTLIIQKRTPAGVPTGGQFAGALHSEAPVTLAKPAVDDRFATEKLREMGLHNRMTHDQVAELTHELNRSLDFSDRGIQETANAILRRDYGYGVDDARTMSTLEAELRDAGRTEEADALARVAAAKPFDYLNEDEGPFATEEELAELASRLTALSSTAGAETPVPASDPRLQAGQVFDKVMADDGTVFHRRRPGTFAGTPYAMRFQANRPLTEEELNQAASLVGYTYAATIRGENISYPDQDTPYSFIVGADMTKSRRDDLGDGLTEFEDQLPHLLQDGSPVRTTSRKGPVGSRAVEGLNDPDLKFEIYYDDIFEPGR